MNLIAAPTSSQEALPADQFRRIARLAHDTAGLMIPESKSAMVRSRIARRMRVLSMSGVGAYLDRVEGGDAQELREMIEVLTTNVTSFFREEHHFQVLKDEIAPALLTKARTGERIRIWSAGCSTGAEPYSIAIALLEHSTAFLETDTKILATDIDRQVLSVARSGAYPADMIRSLKSERSKRYFLKGPDETVKVVPELKNLISFRELNLIGRWPMRGHFDVIFCRNVAIYFDEETQSRVWTRFADNLVLNGWLFVGHSERVPESIGLMPSGNTAYRMIAGAPSAQESLGQVDVN